MPIKVSFPDGSERVFEDNISVKEIAEGISHSLMKKSVVAVVNDKVVDLATKLTADCTLKIITSDTKDAKDKQILLDTMRHSCAHLFAQAMRELYGDKVHFEFGPEIENGFYYDFKLPDGIKVVTEDFPKIEKKMHELSEKDFEIVRKETTKEEAMEFFGKQGEKYKVELLEEKFDSVVVDYLEHTITGTCLSFEAKKGNLTQMAFNEFIEKDNKLISEMAKKCNANLYNKDERKRVFNLINKNIGKLNDFLKNKDEDYKNYYNYVSEDNNLEKFKEEVPTEMSFLVQFIILKYDAKMLKGELKETDFQEGRYDKFKKISAIFKNKNSKPDFLKLVENFISDQRITTYTQGGFTDLCRGPHVPSTGFLKYFKLMKQPSGAQSKTIPEDTLTRVYGTCWATQKELDDYLKMLEEAEKRDHRKLGQQLDLFHMQEEAPGCCFWHPRGWTLYTIIQNYMRKKLQAHGYIEVKTPQIVSKTLWEKSGHWAKYREHMFITRIDEEDMDFAIKPMNCPCHVEIFKNKIRSYKDLPIRMAEFGKCHRYEPSGSLHGLMRVRGFVQDDAHIFCSEDQIASECVAFYQLLKEVYDDFGFKDIKVKFSDRPEMRVGSDALWDKAEKALREPMEQMGIDMELNKGEGAFYGPKLEFTLRDAIGREWQCGTFQVDFNLGQRLGAEYTDADGSKKAPVMLHRAVLGSFERFIAILIENHAGALPLWLAPVQAVVIGVSNDFDKQVENIKNQLVDAGIRCECDLSKETVSYKVRHHSEMKIPYIITIGKKELEDGTLSVRKFGEMKNVSFDINKFVKTVEENVKVKQ